MLNDKMEKLDIQKETVQKCFDRRWKDFRSHNVFSRFIMHLMDLPVKKIIIKISPENILDVGCGIGRTMSKFKKSGFKVTGIDNSEQSLDFCKKLGFVENKEILKMDAAKMNFQDNSFDAVFSEGLLEHFEDFEPFVREMVRVSKKYILLLQPNFHSIAGKILNIATRIIRKGDPGELPYEITDYIKSFGRHNCRLVLAQKAVFGAFTVFLFKK